jgi:hypothetical protein
MWQKHSGQQKSLVGQIDAIMAGGTPGKVRTCGVRFRRRCSGISPNPLIHAPLPVYPHEYWLAIGSLILTRCPPSAAISIQIPTIYPQATHKIFRVLGGRGWVLGWSRFPKQKSTFVRGVPSFASVHHPIANVSTMPRQLRCTGPGRKISPRPKGGPIGTLRWDPKFPQYKFSTGDLLCRFMTFPRWRPC